MSQLWKKPVEEADDSRTKQQVTARDSLLEPPRCPPLPSPNFPGVKKSQAQRSLLLSSLTDPTGTLTREDKTLKAYLKLVVPGWGRRNSRSISSAKPIWHHRQLSSLLQEAFPLQGLGELISSAISEDACLARDCFAELRKIRKWLAGSLVEEGRIA